MTDPVAPMNLIERGRQFYLSSKDAKSAASDMMISPGIAVEDDLLRQFPPTSIVVGAYDPFFDDAIDFAHRLARTKSVRVRLKEYEKLPHSFLGWFILSESSQAIRLIKTWIQEAFEAETEKQGSPRSPENIKTSPLASSRRPQDTKGFAPWWSPRSAGDTARRRRSRPRGSGGEGQDGSMSKSDRSAGEGSDTKRGEPSYNGSLDGAYSQQQGHRFSDQQYPSGEQHRTISIRSKPARSSDSGSEAVER